MSSLQGAHFDVAIVGAGINGASAAQHLSAAGYKVLAVDKGELPWPEFLRDQPFFEA